MNAFLKNKQYGAGTETDTEIRIMVAKVERNDGGMDGSSELADANYYIQNR